MSPTPSRVVGPRVAKGTSVPQLEGFVPATGVDRFGQATGIAHVCGHDMHVAWLMGATRVFAENKDRWKGALVALFQPGEETTQGADAMIKDGLAKRIPKPDVALAQHVIPAPAGSIARLSLRRSRAHVSPVGTTVAVSTIKITLFSGARVQCMTPFGTTNP